MIIGSKIWKIFKQAAKISLKVTCIYPAYRWLPAVELQRSETSGFLKSLEISIGNFTKLLKFPQSFKKFQRFQKKMNIHDIFGFLLHNNLCAMQ